MCGVCGYSTIGKLSPTMALKRANIAKGLLIANQSRGTDSTGVYLQNGQSHILSKDTCYASKFVREPEVINLFKKDSHLMLGHTRQATTGAVTKRNAHPFQIGNIVGVHNGIIHNDDAVSREHDFQIEVDSEVIFALLNKYENNFIQAFKEIKGSASVAWINQKEPNTLYLVAHSNPLSIAHVPSLQTIFLTSEFTTLDAILQSAIGAENYSVYESEEDTVYRIKPDHSIAKTKVTFKEWETYGNRTWENGKWIDKTETTAKTDDTKEGIVYPDDFIHTPQLGKEELTHIQNIGKKKGCDSCHIPLHDYCYFDDLNIDSIFCVDCMPIKEAIDFLWINLKTGEYNLA